MEPEVVETSKFLSPLRESVRLQEPDVVELMME